MTTEQHERYTLGATIVTASAHTGPQLKGAGQAVAAAMVTASLIGVGVAQVRSADRVERSPEDAMGGIDPLDIAASAAPALLRAAPPLDLELVEALGIETRALSADEALIAPHGARAIANTQLPELRPDDLLVAGCPAGALEPMDGLACVRVLRGSELVEVRLRS